MYKIRVFDSLSRVPLTEWNSLAKARCYTYTPEYLEMIESLDTHDNHRRYGMLFDENEQLVGLTHFSITRTDIAIFASGWLRSALKGIRQLFPNFLKIRMLECALPISLTSDSANRDAICHRKATETLAKTLVEFARDNGIFLVIIGAFEPQDRPSEPCLIDLGYQFVACLPVATLDIAWDTPTDYLSSMKSYFRSKLQRHARINEANGIRCELRDQFDHLAEVLWQQWHVVHEHATEYSGETLTPAFYRDFSIKFGTRSKVLLVYSNDSLVGHALLLLDGDTLRWRNFGRTKAENDSLYIYVCQKVVETAIHLGVNRLDMGVTTYEVKRDFGASIIPRRIAIWVSWNIFNRYSAWVYSLLNHIPDIQTKNIFKKSNQPPRAHHEGPMAS